MTPPVFVAGTSELAGAVIVLTGAEGRHAATVRRLAPGERVDVTDGCGLLAQCVVVAAGPGRLELAVQARQAEPEPQPRLAVAQALLKGDRAELAVEIMTEVGVDEIVPWTAERCVTRWRPDRAGRGLARWRDAAREAAKQSRRSRFPLIAEPADGAALAHRARAAGLAVILDPAAELALTTAALPAAGEILLVVGPEGGISPQESALLAAAGAVSARLGPSVLRGSSAGAVAAALVLDRCGRWR